MENHLKDAQLKYLQAQINPHFLFNTLNAGAQLAMMEDANRTYEYIQKVAELFRYNIKKSNEIVTLREEIDLIDNYIYILNVRFSGEIQYIKQIEEVVKDKMDEITLPGMILQPIIENSVNYGIRNIDWQGVITLNIYEKNKSICIEINDNGVGLGSVINRLKIYYDSEDLFKIFSEGENEGTTIWITLPQS